MVNVTIDSIHGSYGIIWWIMVIWIDTSWGCSWPTVSLRSFLLGYNVSHCLSEVFSSCPGFLGRNFRCFSTRLHPLLPVLCFARQGNATSACGESAAQEVPLAEPFWILASWMGWDHHSWRSPVKMAQLWSFLEIALVIHWMAFPEG